MIFLINHRCTGTSSLLHVSVRRDDWKPSQSSLVNGSLCLGGFIRVRPPKGSMSVPSYEETYFHEVLSTLATMTIMNLKEYGPMVHGLRFSVHGSCSIWVHTQVELFERLQVKHDTPSVAIWTARDHIAVSGRFFR